MPRRPAPSPEVAATKGLHLYHSGPSHSSQAVRQVLVEKGLPWTGTVLDLGKFEHAADWFQALNPAGYVPVLVHDGEVWTESVDIMLHLEAAFPTPALSGPRDEHWFHLVEAAHVPCRIVSHQFLFKERRQLSEAQLASLAQRHRNPELIAFLNEFAQGGFTFARVRQAMLAIEAVYAAAQATLSTTPWLAGARPGLADFAVAIVVHRLTYLDFPMATDYPHVADWYARLSARPQFAEAVTEPEGKTFAYLLGR